MQSVLHLHSLNISYTSDSLAPLISDLAIQLMVGALTCGLSAILAFLVVRHELKQTHRQVLHDRITHLLDIGIEHPYLEDTKWCSAYHPSIGEAEKRVRYELYCCAVFNVLQDVRNFANGNRKKIRDFMHVDEIVLMHSAWWRSDPENIKGYDIGFRDFVQSILESQVAAK